MSPSIQFIKIISGGQTGVDRAALDIALSLGLLCGGWCPKGRRAEDGPIPSQYPLQETESGLYPIRTEQNVQDSDGTLILTCGKPDQGTAMTITLAKKHKKPYLVIDLEKPSDPASLVEWLEENQIKVLNVAGPRESKHPGIHDLAYKFLVDLLGKGRE